jgi:hypothetical protein
MLNNIYGVNILSDVDNLTVEVTMEVTNQNATPLPTILSYIIHFIDFKSYILDVLKAA